MARCYTVTPASWAKHLRRVGKRFFWKRERKASKPPLEM